MSISVLAQPEQVELVVHGSLDNDAGLEILRIARAAPDPRQLVVALGDAPTWTPDGLAALLASADLGVQVMTRARSAAPHP